MPPRPSIPGAAPAGPGGAPGSNSTSTSTSTSNDDGWSTVSRKSAMASKSFSAAATGAWGGGGTSAGSGTGAGSSNNTNNKNRKVQALVVDAGAIIKGIRLDSIASELYTTSDVVAEIRDENGRKNLATATSLFGLTVKSVSDEAVREVSTFAKKTGDFATLSRTDIRVLALTWMLEKERKGTAHLRKEPIAAKTWVPSESTPDDALNDPEDDEAAEWALSGETAAMAAETIEERNVGVNSVSEVERESEAFLDLNYWSAPLPSIDLELASLGLTPAPETEDAVELPVAPAKQSVPASEEQEGEKFGDLLFWATPIPSLDLSFLDVELGATPAVVPEDLPSQQLLPATHSRGDRQDVVPTSASRKPEAAPQQKHEAEEPPTEPKEGPKQKSKAEGTSKQKHKVEDATLVAGPSNLSASKRTEIDDDEEDDGEGEWITPESLAAKKSKNKKKRSKKGKKVDTIEVACVTTDFAMQNVLLQMNLKLVSIDGMEITRVKNFVLRCHACFKTTSDMSKKFCPSCGNNTLIRATCSVDADGNMTIYLKKNFQYNLRGTKYSIPAPQGGRSNKDLILREDQKEYERAVKRAAISAKKSNDQLFDLDRDPLDRLKGRVEMPTIGYGRKNPNEARGRRRK